MNRKLKKAPQKYNNYETWANTAAKWDPVWDEDLVWDVTFHEKGTLRSGVFCNVLTESVELGLQGIRKSGCTAVEVIMTPRADEIAPSKTLTLKAVLGQQLHNQKPGSEGKPWNVWHLHGCQDPGLWQVLDLPEPAWELGWRHRHTQGLRLWNRSFKGES